MKTFSDALVQQNNSFFSLFFAHIAQMFVLHKCIILLSTPITLHFCGRNCKDRDTCWAKKKKIKKKTAKKRKDELSYEARRAEVVHKTAQEMGLGQCERYYSHVFDLLFILGVLLLLLMQMGSYQAQDELRDKMSESGASLYKLDAFKEMHGDINACMPCIGPCDLP